MRQNLFKSEKIFGIILLATCVTALLVIPGACKKNTQTNDNLNVQSKSKDNLNSTREVDLKLITDNLVSPLGVVALPDGEDHHDGDREVHNDGDRKSPDNRLFVIDQIGKIWILDAHGNRLPVPFLDLTGKLVTLNPGYDERGLLGLAFHPNYKRNGKFYVYYTAPPRPGGPEAGSTWDNLSVIAEFKVSSSNPNLANIGSERRLLELDDPQSNHNGGTLAFGPDNFLYISIGDGGGANDVGPGHVEDWYAANAGGNGQDIEANLFGDILRIDVDHGTPYGIPWDNPFVGKPGKDEIYAYGLRNPFRYSFDMGGSHRLIAGDAGQNLYEEIDVIKKGGNYGWNVKEGRHCFDAAHPLMEMASCPSVDNFGNALIDPVIEVNNTSNPKGGRAITIIGGNIYRGHSIPQFEGQYIFGSFAQTFAPNAQLFVANPSGDVNWPYQQVALKSFPNDLGHFLKGFGQDKKGEIYLTLSKNLGPAGTSGKVYKLVAVEGANADNEEED